MSMRINDNMAVTRSAEMTAERAAAQRQTGLNSGTLNEIRQDADDDLQTVRDRPEVEGATVRDATEDGGGQQEERKKKKAPKGEDSDLRSKASENLLNLPVTSGKDAENGARRFDMRV